MRTIIVCIGRFDGVKDMSTSESHFPRPKQAPSTEQPRSLTSEELIGKHRHELVIRHAGSDYRLRITRHGKLILTK